MKKVIILIIVFLVLSLFSTFTLAQEQACLHFFYGEGCPHCGKVEPFVESLSEDPTVHVEVFEVYSERENALLLQDYFEAYNVPQNMRGVPVVFIGDTYLVGDTPILENLEAKIEIFRGQPCPCITGNETCAGLESLSLVTVIGAALVDSINPCAIAVLLILMGALLASGERARALKAGIGFTISIYIVYFLFGLGLFSAIQISGLSFWFYRFIGFLAIVIGLFNIKDYFSYGAGGFVMEIPRRWRPRLKKLLNSVTSPMGAFFMGFLVCLFELPCTGGPYLFILGLLAQKTTQMAAIPILLLYNLVFVVPLILLTLFIYLGLTNVEKASEWKEKNIRKLHLIAGIVMLALGLIVILGFI